ncbi:SagB/ThcOx family dehydrogenase [Methylocaldum sp.]|uniref:SagB/ThcOx family dehydrogenase n=1 Tax=Methylocaldum sp. TaxID=1969727 RepID=UPI002D7592A0|nr:SagB/ThcOx family dehydrogenase [Methylocaldum sp.]HYE33901.1 SagB/ThcOx family dehydrogenase [Methylocaldum sp.]
MLRFLLAGILAAYTALPVAKSFDTGRHRIISAETIVLPPPQTTGPMSLEETLHRRASVRDFLGTPISLQDVSQLLWAAQGITRDDHLRTAPSAGALYPLELYLIAGDVSNVPAGTYRYLPNRHRVKGIHRGDFRADLAAAAQHQDWLKESAAILVFAAVEERTTEKYGSRGLRYIDMEAGHAAQNVLLQAVALGLGGTPLGDFDDERAAQVLDLPSEEKVLYLVPIGNPR